MVHINSIPKTKMVDNGDSGGGLKGPLNGSLGQKKPPEGLPVANTEDRNCLQKFRAAQARFELAM